MIVEAVQYTELIQLTAHSYMNNIIFAHKHRNLHVCTIHNAANRESAGNAYCHYHAPRTKDFTRPRMVGLPVDLNSTPVIAAAARLLVTC